ncbi:MAG: hypothetical protein WA708_09600 [Acidobacteriaceae bacterium]
MWRVAGLAFGMIAMSLGGRGQVATTTVQDTVYRADGTFATGTILVSWPAFVSAAGKTVAAGNLSAAIGANGQVTLNLAPNVGATPAGSYYTAVYHLDDGTVKTEYWEVPNIASTTVAAIRTLVMPASVAVQTLTATEVNSMLGQYLPLAGGSLSGALQLPGDPQQAMQAATKNYVDNAVSPLSATIAGVVSAKPTGSQTIVQPSGTTLAANNFAGRSYASQFQTGGGNNGIANVTSSSNCTVNAPGGPSGCTVVVDPSYGNSEQAQGTNQVAVGPGNNFKWPLNTHVHDERNGTTADYYENPFSKSPLQASGNSITADYTLDFQQWPLYSADNPGTEILNANDYQGGYNFYNYYNGNQPQYFFKTYYSNLDLNTTNYSSGQQEAIQNNVACHGTGDCIGMTQLVTCDGGMNGSDDEGCHGGDWTVTEDPLVYKGTVTQAAAVGATVIHTNGTAGQKTQGQDRLLVDTNSADIITGTSITGYTGALPTGNNNSADNPLSAQDSNANFPVSTMVQLCYAGSDNGAGGAAGCAAGSQPTGFIPSAAGMINPPASVLTNVVASYTASAPSTGLPAGFCTPSTLQSTNSGGPCYLPPSGVACVTDQEEYETVNYTYNSAAQQITLENLRFPHLNGLFFAHGGLCGYAVEQQSDVFGGDGISNGISQVFPVEGSPNSTSFYYISQRVNNGYSLPVLGVSNDIGGNTTTGGGECFSLNISAVVLQSDNKTVVIATSVPFGEGNLSVVNGMTLTINTPNSTYNGNYVVSWGALNSNNNELSYVLPASPTGAVPTSGTASFCNTNYKLYPAVRVNSVLDAANNQVDGTMNTMPSPVAFAVGDTVMEPHYPWIYTGHDAGRGVNQFIPRFYGGGSLYGMTYGYLLSGTPFVGFSINNATDQNRYLGYGGTHEAPGFGYDLDGEWDVSFETGAPESAVIGVGGCKPAPIGCNRPNSNFDVLLMPNGSNGKQALNYDPNSLTWTFGSNYFPQNNPPIDPSGTVQAYNLHAVNSVTATQVAVGAGYLFNLGGAIGITTTPANPGFSTWYASYAYGFGAQNTKVIDGYLYRGASANTVDCGTGSGDTSCTFTLGVLNAGTSVNAPTVAASSLVTTPSLAIGGGSPVTHIAYYTTGTVTPAAVAAQSCSDQTFSVSGLTATDNLGSVHPPGALGNVSIDAYSSAANTLTLHFCNASAGSVVPPAGAYTFLAMH